MKTVAIILAAGSGKRMQAGQNKLFLTLQGKTILEHAVSAFQNSSVIDAIVIVAKAEELLQVQHIVPHTAYPKILHCTAGGKERQDSVLCGLAALPQTCERVFIHDGARPFVTKGLIERMYDQVTPDCGVIAAVPVKDTIKRVNAEYMVQQTLVRSELWHVQTPQCFYTAPILQCYRQAQQDNFCGTDDASLAEQYGLAVKIVPAYYENMKLTTPEDLDVAEVFLQRLQYRKED